MSFAARTAASASRLVSHFGTATTTVVLTKVGGTFDRATRELTTSPATMTLACTTPAPYVRKLVDGQRIQVDDMRVLVSKAGAALTFELEPDLLAAVGGKTYKVVSVLPLAGSYVLQLRGNPS